jgi:hypothetical protein
MTGSEMRIVGYKGSGPGSLALIPGAAFLRFATPRCYDFTASFGAR